MTTTSSSSLGTGMAAETNRDATDPHLPKSPELEHFLGEVKKLIERDDPKGALALISRSRLVSPWLVNAKAVCHLRMNNVATALGVFRDLVLSRIGITLRNDIPIVFKANFATALLMSDNLTGCREVLYEIRDQHPAARRLNDLINRLTKNLTTWQVFCWYLGFVPKLALPADFQPGDVD